MSPFILFFLQSLSLFSVLRAQYFLSYPPPRGSPHNPYTTPDPCLLSPLGGSPGCPQKASPCPKTPDSNIVTKWKAGQPLFIEFGNILLHGNVTFNSSDPSSKGLNIMTGNCFFSLSYDEGKTWGIVASNNNTNCPDASHSWGILLPKETPACDRCLFAWTFINGTKSRDTYMNCADVSITSDSKNDPSTFINSLSQLGLNVQEKAAVNQTISSTSSSLFNYNNNTANVVILTSQNNTSLVNATATPPSNDTHSSSTLSPLERLETATSGGLLSQNVNDGNVTTINSTSTSSANDAITGLQSNNSPVNATATSPINDTNSGTTLTPLERLETATSGGLLSQKVNDGNGTTINSTSTSSANNAITGSQNNSSPEYVTATPPSNDTNLRTSSSPLERLEKATSGGLLSQNANAGNATTINSTSTSSANNAIAGLQSNNSAVNATATSPSNDTNSSITVSPLERLEKATSGGLLSQNVNAGNATSINSTSTSTASNSITSTSTATPPTVSQDISNTANLSNSNLPSTSSNCSSSDICSTSPLGYRYCSGDNYVVCDHGKSVPMPCAPGTKCSGQGLCL